MSDSNPMAAFGDFGKWVPGFDFLKTVGQPGSGKASLGLPGLGSWVAPTVNVEELDKRIQELRTVLFWLEQNSTALKATIQAMEVQKMTLSALQGMNLSMQDMAKAFSIPTPQAAAAPQAPAKGFAGLEVPPLQAAAAPAAPARPRGKPSAKADPATDPAAAAAPAPAAGVVDPAQWWGALTQQFQTIADAALRDAKARSADLPGGMKSAAEQALKGTEAWADAAQAVAKTVTKTATKTATQAAAKPGARKVAAKAKPATSRAARRAP